METSKFIVAVFLTLMPLSISSLISPPPPPSKAPNWAVGFMLLLFFPCGLGLYYVQENEGSNGVLTIPRYWDKNSKGNYVSEEYVDTDCACKPSVFHQFISSHRASFFWDINSSTTSMLKQLPSRIGKPCFRRFWWVIFGGYTIVWRAWWNFSYQSFFLSNHCGYLY